MKIRSKVWLEVDGELVFGPGRARVLRAVEEAGSINGAAKALEMSYRHVWSQVRTAEQRLGKPLLIKKAGGAHGGGATLTPYAQDLLVAYEKLYRNVHSYTERQHDAIFE